LGNVTTGTLGAFYAGSTRIITKGEEQEQSNFPTAALRGAKARLGITPETSVRTSGVFNDRNLARF
jgi:hypothetical protein